MRPQIGWHDCLAPVRTPHTPTRADQFAFKKGQEAHTIIEERCGMKDEKLHTFTDPSLPFDITYHPDVYDPRLKIVYDIKPFGWMARDPANFKYAVYQVTGYKHFLGAEAAAFYLYQWEGGDVKYLPYHIPPPWMPDWETLCGIAMAAYETLQGHGVEKP